ncbi:TetR/AcrR family transcriptional regulator [Marmoricola sp. URHB0036]|uniref:TetR/AcrR family transcriptional regulator n=1 Tax=Marmoricola sp. URHB0036 TaxID=1298863 RepID=UPI000487F60E|nr:TetR family transcriptional regulator [Marmoricola sp. URHB0036]
MARVPTELRRQQLIEAAMTVIAREGVDGATTRKIADEAQAPLATLHYCFHNKENLLWAVFEHLAKLVRDDLARTSAPDPAATVLVTHLVRETVQWAIENPAPNRAQIEIWSWARRNDPEFASRIYDMFIQTWKECLRQVLAPLPEEHLETLTRVFVAVIDGLCMQLITHGDDLAVLREAETAREMLMAYVGSP